MLERGEAVRATVLAAAVAAVGAGAFGARPCTAQDAVPASLAVLRPPPNDPGPQPATYFGDMGIPLDSADFVLSDDAEQTFLGRYTLKVDTSGRASVVRVSPQGEVMQSSQFVQGLAKLREQEAAAGEDGLTVERTVLLSEAAFGEKGLWNLQLSSRANVRVENRLTEAAAGALLQFGKDLDLLSANGPRSGQWYLFVSADGGALTWRPRTGLPGDPTGGLKYYDYITMGEAQAGVNMRVGQADMALAYVYRDWSYKGVDVVEQFGAATVSFKF